MRKKVADESENIFYICYDGSLPDIYDGTEIEFTGLPVAATSYDNISGGTTNAIVIIASQVNSTASASAEPSATPENVFNTTVDEVVKVLSAKLKDANTITPDKITPAVIEDKPDDSSTVTGMYYDYSIMDGINLGLLESTESGKIKSVHIFATVDKLTNESAETLGGYEAALIAMFEPNANTLFKVDDELGIVDAGLSKDYISFADGSMASYTYSISKGSVSLFISPL